MPHQCTNCGRAFEDGSKEMLAGCPECDGNKFQFIPSSRVDGGDGTTGESPSQPSQASQPSQPTQPSSAPQQSAADQSTADHTTGDQSTAKQPAQSKPERTESRSNPASTPSETTPETVSKTTPETASKTTPKTASDTPSETPPTDENEDGAQSDARSSVVSSSELEQARQQMATAEEERLAQVGGESAAADGEAATDEAAADVGDPQADETDSPDLDALREELNSQFESIKIKAPGQYELNLMELYDREEYIISLREDGKYVIEMPETWRDDG